MDIKLPSLAELNSEVPPVVLPSLAELDSEFPEPVIVVDLSSDEDLSEKEEEPVKKPFKFELPESLRARFEDEDLDHVR